MCCGFRDGPVTIPNSEAVVNAMMNIRKTFQTLVFSGLLVITSQSVNAGGYHHKHHRGHHGHGDALAAGLIIGGLFGYFLNEDRHRHSSYVYRNYRSDYYPRSRVVYKRVET